ncbi:MAG: hypothetical protein DMF41_00645, partial [Verrucomicrobia bacterium]
MAGTLRFLMALGSAHASSGSRQSPLTEKFLLERIASPRWLQCQFSRDWGKLRATFRSRSGAPRLDRDRPGYAAQCIVVDHVLVTQTDNCLPFNSQRLVLQTLILGRGNLAATVVRILSAE